MPKALNELKNPKRGVKRIGGKKIDFTTVVQKIIESKKYWPVSEVYTDLVQKKVGRFRTMKLLNGASGTGHKLERLEADGKYWYGPNPETQKQK